MFVLRALLEPLLESLSKAKCGLPALGSLELCYGNAESLVFYPYANRIPYLDMNVSLLAAADYLPAGD